MNFQPIVTLIAAFLGAWLANLNFNKQKKMELQNLILNMNEEIKDVRDEMVRVIPVLVKSYDCLKSPPVSDTSDIRLTRKNEFYILPIALEKLYSQIHSERRKVLKSMLAIDAFLSEHYEKINSLFKSGRVFSLVSNAKDVNEMANAFRVYIISSSILYFYSNACCENAENIKLDGLNDKEIVKKVMASLMIEFKIDG